MAKSALNKLSPAETWVDKYADYLYSYALFRVSDNSAAEDLVQDTFIAALTARSRYRGDSSEKTWLTAILKNKITDFFRKRYRQRTDQFEDLDMFSSDQHFDSHNNWMMKPQKWQQNPHKTLEESEFMDVLLKCLEKINPKQADAFRLREISQAETDEICNVLDISKTNFWVLMHRARLFMRRCLEIKWFNPEAEGDNL